MASLPAGLRGLSGLQLRGLTLSTVLWRLARVRPARRPSDARIATSTDSALALEAPAVHPDVPC